MKPNTSSPPRPTGATGLEQATHGPRLRIAYVVHTFDTGGLERCIALLANRLDRRFFHPLVICLHRTGAAARWIRSDDVDIVELHKRAGNDPRVAHSLAQALRSNHVDLVQSHNWGTLVETAIASALTGVPHIHAEHGQELSAIRQGWKRRLLRRWAGRLSVRRLSALVVVAHSVKQRIQASWRVPTGRMYFIPNGVPVPVVTDDNARLMIRSRLGVSPDRFIVGSVGRLAPVKDFGTAIASMALLRASDVPAELLIVGEGPELTNLVDKADVYRIRDSVHFVGYQQNVGDWLAAFDVFVNSSLSEAMSLSLLEAMAAGLPIVASDVGDNASLVAGTCGLTVPSATPSAFAAALDFMFRHPAQRAEFARAGVQRHRTCYSVDAMTNNYEALYRRVADESLAAGGSTLSRRFGKDALIQ